MTERDALTAAVVEAARVVVRDGSSAASMQLDAALRALDAAPEEARAPLPGDYHAVTGGVCPCEADCPCACHEARRAPLPVLEPSIQVGPRVIISGDVTAEQIADVERLVAKWSRLDPVAAPLPVPERRDVVAEIVAWLRRSAGTYDHDAKYGVPELRGIRVERAGALLSAADHISATWGAKAAEPDASWRTCDDCGYAHPVGASCDGPRAPSPAAEPAEARCCIECGWTGTQAPETGNWCARHFTARRAPTSAAEEGEGRDDLAGVCKRCVCAGRFSPASAKQSAADNRDRVCRCGHKRWEHYYLDEEPALEADVTRAEVESHLSILGVTSPQGKRIARALLRRMERDALEAGTLTTVRGQRDDAMDRVSKLEAAVQVLLDQDANDPQDADPDAYETAKLDLRNVMQRRPRHAAAAALPLAPYDELRDAADMAERRLRQLCDPLEVLRDPAAAAGLEAANVLRALLDGPS